MLKSQSWRPGSTLIFLTGGNNQIKETQTHNAFLGGALFGMQGESGLLGGLTSTGLIGGFQGLLGS